MSGNGLTSNSVRQTISSDPAQAQQLGAYFAGERTTTTETKTIGTFSVDGEENGVTYGRLDSRDVGRNMAGQIDMRPGNVYTIEADGEIDKSWFFGGDVSPTDKQRGRSGTRLQVAITDADGEVVRREDYSPGMQISTDRPGQKLGFVFADGDLSDNTGDFDVTVRETSTRRVETNVGIIAADADGIDRAGRAVADALSTAPEAASLPTPKTDLARVEASRGLAIDRVENEIQTTDGYRLRFRENEVQIDWPGRHDDGSAETRIVGRDVIEGDGTRWNAQDGNYVLPNGSMITLAFDENDKIKDFTFVHGDSRVDVEGIGKGEAEISEARSGGLEYRRRAVEDNIGGDTFRMGGLNDGWSDLDITWNLETLGQNVGLLEEAGIDVDSNWILQGAPYMVDPDLRPQFGTRDYERALRSEIEDIRSAISGGAQLSGASRDVGRLIADHLLGGSGTYDAYAQQLQASRGGQNIDPAQAFQQMLMMAWLQQMLGGVPAYHGNLDNAMGAVQALQQMMAQASGRQSAYDQATNNLRSFIPQYQQQQGVQDAAAIVDQVLRGIGQQRRRQPRSRLQRFDGVPSRGSRTRTNVGAERIQRQVAGDRLDVNKERVQELASELRVKIGDDDIGTSDMERLRSLSSDERVAVMNELSGSELKALGKQMPGTDDADAGKFMAALARDAEKHPTLVRPAIGHILDGLDETNSSDADDILQYMQEDLGGGDISEEGNAKQAADRLAHIGESNLRKMTNIHSEGNTDEDELEVVGRARGQVGTGENAEEVSELLSETVRKVGDYDVDDDLIKKLSAATREERLAALSKLSSTERQRFVSDDGADYEEEMGQLMADLVKDARTDPRAQAILRDFTKGTLQNDDGDDVLQYMQQYLGGGDIDESSNMRRAARALSVLDNDILATMKERHEKGWDDTDELKTLEVARGLK